MAVTVAVESPLQDDVRALVAQLNAYLLPLSPPEFQFNLTVEQMAGADTTVFIARDENGHAVGCAALKNHGDGLGEIKRMYTAPEVRGKRVGRALIAALEANALEQGLTQIKLETGTGEAMEPAQRLYLRCGYTSCGAFHDYPESEHNAYFEKALTR